MKLLVKRKIWDVNDQRAQKIHRLIEEMIAVDLQPFSVVEDIGFQRLWHHLCPSYPIPSRKFMKENIVQGIYALVKGSIYQDVLLAKYLSFTSDGWTSSDKCLFLSLTAHWIDDEFEQRNAILSMTPFNQKHTAFHISECLQNAMEAHQIPASKVHVIVLIVQPTWLLE